MNYCLPLQLRNYKRKDRVTKLSHLAARPSLAPRPLLVFIPFFFFCPTDQPTFSRGRAMGNETFYGDGLRAGKDIFVALSSQSFPEGYNLFIASFLHIRSN